MTDLLLALEAATEMPLCGCQKSNYNPVNIQSCVCRKNGLKNGLFAPKYVVVLILKMNLQSI